MEQAAPSIPRFDPKVSYDSFLGLILPYAILLSLAGNTPLHKFGITYVYALLMVGGIVGMIMRGIRPSGIRNNFPLLAFLAAVTGMAILHLAIFDEPETVMSAVLIYSLVPIYWFFYFSHFDGRYLSRLARLSIPLVYVIGALGVVQFFWSPDLYGMVEDKTMAMQSALNTGYDVYSAFFRASSTLGSPQVYGLYMALSVIMIHALSRKLSLLSWLGLGFLCFAGMLSGNKSFVLVVGIYLLGRTATAVAGGVGRAIAAVMVIATVVAGLLVAAEYIPALERLISLDKMVEQEQGDSRLNRYGFIMENTDPFVGNGIGSLTNKSAPGIRASESFILKIYFEMGAGVTAVFLAFMACAFYYSPRSGITGIRVLIAAIFVSMIIVHAFESPIFFLFWGLLISAFSVMPRAAAPAPAPVPVPAEAA